MRLFGLSFSELIGTLPFFLMHAAAVYLLILVGFSWAGLAWCLGAYFFRGIFVTLGYHRYFAHRSYKTSRWFQAILAFFGASAMQRGVLSWAANHRDHHKFSDTERDQHSPVAHGFFHSHVGWTFNNSLKNISSIADLTKFPELVWINKYWVIAPVLFILSTYLLGGLVGLAWGGIISTVLLWHFTFMVNSVCHMIGSRPFNTPDNSRNVWWLAIATLGESFQNSHHNHQYSANQGMHWYELDIGYWIIKLWQKVGLVWNVKTYRP